MKKQLLLAALAAALTLGNGLQAGPLFDAALKKGGTDLLQTLASLILGLKATTLINDHEMDKASGQMLGWPTEANNTLGAVLNAFNALAIKQFSKLKGVMEELANEAPTIDQLRPFYEKVYQALKPNEKYVYGKGDSLPQSI